MINYYNEPVIDEYGFADFGVGEPAVPSRFLFPEDLYSEVTPDGDAEPEYWKEVEPDYWISNLGNLYSFKTGKLLKPKRLDREGHVGYALSKNGSRRYEYQHRLIAENYIPKEKKTDSVVRHINGDPNDNDPSNLAWGTQLENWEDSVRHGTARSPTDEDREKGFQKIRKPVRATNISTGEEKEFISLNEACRQLGVCQSNAWKTIMNQRDKTCGWRFEYI